MLSSNDPPSSRRNERSPNPNAPPRDIFQVGSQAFTTTELLVVIGIILLLASIGIPSMLALKDRQKAKHASAEIQLLQAVLQDFKTEFGDYPNLELLKAKLAEKGSSLALPSGSNLGNEVLVACLCTYLPTLYARNIYLPASLIGVDGEKLIDLDGDGLKELSDPWSRPYVYFHPSDYHTSVSHAYSITPNAEQNASAQAKANANGLYYQLTEYQLWSCGSNQENDTNCGPTCGTPEDDDLRSWRFE